MKKREIFAAVLSLVPCAALCAMAATGFLGGVPFVCAAVQTAIMALSAVFGSRILLRGLGALKLRRVCWEFFVTLAVAAGVLFSLYEMFMIIFTHRGAERLLFAPCSGLISASLFGRYFCVTAKTPVSASAEIDALGMMSATVLRDGVEMTVPADSVSQGDVVSVRPGGIIPCDGVIMAGRADIDERIFTDSAAPVLKGEGDPVFAGSRDLSGHLTVSASGESVLKRLCASYKTAKKRDFYCFTEKITRVAGLIVLAVVLIAAVAVSAAASFDLGFFVFSAALIAAAPCAMALPRAFADIFASRRTVRDGIRLNDPSALERLSGCTSAVISVTGAATVGRLSVKNTVAFEGGENGVIRLAAALCAEYSSADCVAITGHCRQLGIDVPPCITPEILAGRVTGIVDGIRAAVSGLPEDTAPLAEDFGGPDDTVRAVFSGDTAVGLIFLEDSVKPAANPAIKSLSDAGIAVAAVCGTDLPEGAGLSVPELYGGLSPEEKLNTVEKRRPTAMIGGGISDAPALRAADFSFALASGSDIAKKSADAVLLRNDVRDVLRAAEIARISDRAEKISAAALAVYRVLLCAGTALSCAFLGLGAGAAVFAAGAVFGIIPPAVCAAVIRK